MTDEDDDRVPIAWGDVGAITIMAGVAIFTLWLIGDLMLGGHPLDAFIPKPAPQTAQAPTAEEQRNTPMHLEKGEVRIFLPSKPKTPPQKPPEKPKS
ncbi:MAG TPA: hypothetical protein VMF58_11865 [Rhizomicrobium sp.]|nr:hypothetical protein [Rhizomicrobium sp.]